MFLVYEFSFWITNLFILPAQEYSRRQTTKPVKHPGMEHIKQPNDRDSQCKCRRTLGKVGTRSAIQHLWLNCLAPVVERTVSRPGRLVSMKAKLFNNRKDETCTNKKPYSRFDSGGNTTFVSVGAVPIYIPIYKIHQKGVHVIQINKCKRKMAGLS